MGHRKWNKIFPLFVWHFCGAGVVDVDYFGSLLSIILFLFFFCFQRHVMGPCVNPSKTEAGMVFFFFFYK